MCSNPGGGGSCECSTMTNISYAHWTFYSLIILSIHSLIYCATTRYTREGRCNASYLRAGQLVEPLSLEFLLKMTVFYFVFVAFVFYL
jgi:hypothetical protein